MTSIMTPDKDGIIVTAQCSRVNIVKRCMVDQDIIWNSIWLCLGNVNKKTDDYQIETAQFISTEIYENEFEARKQDRVDGILWSPL